MQSDWPKVARWRNEESSMLLSGFPIGTGKLPISGLSIGLPISR